MLTLHTEWKVYHNLHYVYVWIYIWMGMGLGIDEIEATIQLNIHQMYDVMLYTLNLTKSSEKSFFN